MGHPSPATAHRTDPHLGRRTAGAVPRGRSPAVARLWTMLLALPALLCLLVPAADAAAGDVPRPLQGVGFAQHLDAALPLDARFRGRSGEVRPLGRHFGQRPVVLVLGYYGCETLCPHLLHGVREVLEGTGLTAGRDFEVVVVSIDPEEGPAEARLRAAALLGGQDQGWHLLTGEAAAIDRLAAATGFGYRRDPQTGQYAHPAGFVVAIPEGRSSQ